MIKRARYLEAVEPFVGKPLAKVFTGLRRVGKSGLLALLRERLEARSGNAERMVWIDMETLDFPFLDSDKALYQHCQKQVEGPGILFLDEAQEIPAWQKGVAALLKKGWDVYATGSNAHMLSSDHATHLVGRHIEIPVQGLSFPEYLEFARVYGTALPEEREERFWHYLRWGSFPGIHQIGFAEQPWRQYLDAIQNTVVLRDVVSRFQIRNVRLLEDVYTFLLDNLGQFSTAKSIADCLKNQRATASQETVQEYIRALESAFAILKVRRYDLKGKKLMERNEKYFAGDLGLRTARRGFQPSAVSGMLENAVCLELRRRGCTVHVGKMGDREVDFVAERRGDLAYFQVAYLMTDESTLEREYGSLEQIRDNYPKTVLSMDRTAPRRGGIRHAYLPDWMEGMTETSLGSGTFEIGPDMRKETT
ncbi:MAG TPA: ATP-binding protein [Fibrobacteria bacterium]|nr:ATP-binding protein [Fibrobacteria bacterium]